MRWLLLVLPFLILGLTPVYNSHDSQEKIDEEFRNLYLSVQPKQFTIVLSTPAANEFQEGEMVILDSGQIKLVLTKGTTIYEVIFSSFGRNVR